MNGVVQGVSRLSTFTICESGSSSSFCSIWSISLHAWPTTTSATLTGTLTSRRSATHSLPSGQPWPCFILVFVAHARHLLPGPSHANGVDYLTIKCPCWCGYWSQVVDMLRNAHATLESHFSRTSKILLGNTFFLEGSWRKIVKKDFTFVNIVLALHWLIAVDMKPKVYYKKTNQIPNTVDIKTG